MKDYRLHTTLAVVLSSVIGASAAVRAHDTNTSHPRITEMVVKSLVKLDAKDAAYCYRLSAVISNETISAWYCCVV